jgi:hypothetical protein
VEPSEPRRGDDSVGGAVVVISPKPGTFGKIEAVWTIPAGQCLGPQGMAVGPDHEILLGCNDPTQTVPATVIIDDRTGSVIETLPGEDGADQVWYNEGDGQYFLARGGGANPQKLGIVDVDADPGPLDQDVATGLPNTAATRMARLIRSPQIRSLTKYTFRSQALREARSARMPAGATPKAA